MQQNENEVKKEEVVNTTESDLPTLSEESSVKVLVETLTEKDIEEVETSIEKANTTSIIKSDQSFSETYQTTSQQFSLIKETANSLADMERIASMLITSQLCPLKKTSDVVLAIITGNQYGFHFMTSVNNIFPINGKPTMSVHLHRALLLKHKIVFNKIVDNEALYDFAKLDADGKVMTRPINTQQGIKQVPIIVLRDVLSNQPENTTASLEVDRVTRYEFTRLVKQIDNTFAKIKVISEFKLSDANKAGLLDKDNWVKHLPRMLDARAFSIGSKEIASDILLGVYSISELADEFDVKYTISSSLEENVILK